MGGVSIVLQVIQVKFAYVTQVGGVKRLFFANYAAAKAFSDGVPQCISSPCAIVGESCVVHTAGPLGGDNDEFCQDNGCQILSDRTTPVAYTAGSNGDGSCGEDDNDGDGNADRQPAPED